MMRLASLLLAAAALSGCRHDPVPQAIIDGLPADNSPNGPLHRPGQPCLACHDKYGGATELAVAGTVFALDATMKKLVPAPNIKVTIIDSNSSNSRNKCTNAAGNFFVTAAEWSDITYPLTPIAGGRTMQSLIGRDGSCATCHKLPDADSIDPVTGAAHDSAGAIIVDLTSVDPSCSLGGG